MADIDINVPGASAQMLLELIKGQQAAATEIRLQNARLFGGDGQPGAIPTLFAMQQKLTEKLDTNKDELVAKIETAKDDLSGKMVSQKKEIEDEIDAARKEHSELDKKVSRFGTIGGTLYGVLVVLLSILGIWHKAGH
jgi:hypothetical protein